MDSYYVTCTKKDGADVDRRIDGIGGSSGGRNWYLDIDEAIRQIESKTSGFYTSVNGKSVWIIVKEHSGSRRKYLTTEGDNFPPNNLLNLRNCP